MAPKPSNIVEDSEVLKNIPFHSLSPVSDKEKHKQYCDALEWAFLNRKNQDIKNIALTGNYGSGKSSILKTFKERELQGLKFLNISLATFKEEIEEKKENKYSHLRSDDYLEFKNDQVRLIELSILQQIFYHEKYENIPESRFKKIRSLNSKQVENAAYLLIGLIFTFYTFFNFNVLRNLLEIPEPLFWFGLVMKVSLAVGFLALLFNFIERLVKFSQKLTISKFNFQNLEIQVAENLDKSILNNHLDEILYFFEATDYNVVIIEDLDRFEQTEIFTKLREINLLINNSKSIEQDVVFIYAVRDEMFKDKDRTKFFDFIIPVIPVINYSNSNEQLTRALKVFKYSISPELIDDVAFYIDDMRLLYNIVNEFHIYFQKFGGDAFLDKLFAIIVYKNIYPEDFVKIVHNEGILYKQLVLSKSSWIRDRIAVLNDDNNSFKIEIEQLEKVLPQNLNELKSVYLLEYINRAASLTNFKVENTTYSVKQMFEDDLFDKLMNNSVSYNSPFNSTIPFKFKFSDIEKQVDPNQGYLERKSLVKTKNSGRLNILKNKIKDNEAEKNIIKNAKIKYLLKDKKITISPPSNRQDHLILLLIRNGYIAEDYLNYISYFYSGSISEQDHWFLMNIRNETKSDFDYRLDKVENVIKKISESDFYKIFVANYDLLNYLIENTGFESKKSILFKKLADETDESFEFVKAYIKDGGHSATFIETLSYSWKNIWNYLDNNSFLTDDEKLTYYILILNNSILDDLEKIAANSDMVKWIDKSSDFLSIIDDTERLKDLIDLLKVKFTNINFAGISEDVLQFIYDKENYALNPYMIKLIVKTFGEFNETKFNQSNYSALRISNCSSLLKYVDSNINKYVGNVYLKIEDNIKEEQSYLIQLLNHEQLTKVLKERLISHTHSLITDLSKLNCSIDFINYILENKKAEAKWSNVLFKYEKDDSKFSSILIDFLNNLNHAKILSSEPLVSKDDKIVNFRKAFLLNNDIQDEFYHMYVKSFPFTYKDLHFENLSKLKTRALVQNGRLLFNLNNYSKLKKTFSPLHLRLAKDNLSLFLEIFSELNVSETDLHKLLIHYELYAADQIKLIEVFETSKTFTEVTTLTSIGQIYSAHPGLKISITTLSSILLKSSNTIGEKIKLFLERSSEFSNDFVMTFLSALGGDFAELTKKGPMPTFQKSVFLELFFNRLKDMNVISKIKDKGDFIKITTFRN